MNAVPSGQPLPLPAWQQITVEFTDYTQAEQITAQRLAPIMNSISGSWWFIRKAPCWRVRYLPERPGAEAQVRDAMVQALENLQAEGGITGWVDTLYEPEAHAFGGPDGMGAAHRLFCHDSQEILTRPSGFGDHRREHTILLCSTLLRAAGQDWYEQGDVWARVAENRPLSPQTPNNRPSTFVAGLRRLMTVDAGPDSPLTGPDGQLAGIAAWASAFHTAGEVLGGLARRGELTRGLRAVLAHHMIFHWNRLGLSYESQSFLAAAAREVVFG
ncbi:MAG TPA: thiopeptide-type bacteriocin biosynthesis protein [Pseudonocardiaceae bacterium]|nr:thiopeptide-type bacteriocin biosynthesis protein [Pseudonocardiaceae bacterium]